MYRIREAARRDRKLRFFDRLDHDWLLRFLEHRVGDPRVLRLIRKWLRAGVSEEGEWSPTRKGTPQGAVISPLLANVYLRYVLDLWISWWRNHSRAYRDRDEQAEEGKSKAGCTK